MLDLFIRGGKEDGPFTYANSRDVQGLSPSGGIRGGFPKKNSGVGLGGYTNFQWRNAKNRFFALI